MSLAEGMRDLYGIFERALGEPRARRSAYVAQACGDRIELRDRIGRLLALAESDDGFLDRSPIEPSIQIDATESTCGPGHRIGAYRLLRRLGRGGMAEVWLAERTEGGFQQRAAVKIIRDADGSVSAHFATEREILARLVHPGIARLYDGGVDADGSAYMIMEYVEGEHLIAYCNERRLGLAERLGLFLQICDAVAYAHTHLVIHRDLKPANILVTAEGVVMLLDFGIAKVLDRESAKEVTRTMHMSPAYAAPEQLAGGYVGTATDVYALGVILFELLTGSLPWSSDASSLTLAVKRLLEANAPAPSRVAGAQSPVSARAIDGDLDAIVGMALRREPSARYPDARSLAEEVRRHLDHKPVQARIGARAYVLRRFLRRHWIGLATAAGLFVAMAMAIVAVAWQARRTKLEAQRAEAVQSFVIDLFRTNSSRQADPVKARQTTARELLDIGAHRIESGLSGAPAEKLALLRVFGDLYDDLGLKPEELKLRREAVDLSRELHSSRSTEVVSDLVALAGAMHGTDEDSQCEEVLKEAAAILDNRHDDSSMLRGRVLAATAEALQASNPRRGLSSAEEAVRVLDRYPPSTDLAEALYMSGLLTQYSGGNVHAAIPPLQRAIEISRAVDGVPNPKLPIYYYQLAEDQAFDYQLDAAEATAREGLTTSLAINGDDHIYAMRSRLKIGEVLLLSDRNQEGLEHILEAKAQIPKLVGSTDTLHRPVILRSVGVALLKVGDLDGALDNLEESMAVLRTLDKPQLAGAFTLEDIADVLMGLGRLTEARQALHEANTVREQINQPGRARGGLLSARLAEEEGHLLEARRIFDAIDPVDPSTPRNRVSVIVLTTVDADIELRSGKLENAARLAASASDIARKTDFASALKTKVATSELIEGLSRLRLGDAEAARPLLERALATRQDKLFPKSPLIAEAELALAECDLAQGRRSDAAARIDRAAAIEEQHSSLAARYTEPVVRLRSRLNAR